MAFDEAATRSWVQRIADANYSQPGSTAGGGLTKQQYIDSTVNYYRTRDQTPGQATSSTTPATTGAQATPQSPAMGALQQQASAGPGYQGDIGAGWQDLAGPGQISPRLGTRLQPSALAALGARVGSGLY